MWELNFESSDLKFNSHAKFLVAHPKEDGRKSAEGTSVRVHKHSGSLTLRFACPNASSRYGWQLYQRVRSVAYLCLAQSVPTVQPLHCETGASPAVILKFWGVVRYMTPCCLVSGARRFAASSGSCSPKGGDNLTLNMKTDVTPFETSAYNQRRDVASR